MVAPSQPGPGAGVTALTRGERRPATCQSLAWHGGCKFCLVGKRHTAMGQYLKDEETGLERSSHPDTDVTLFLRIETGGGPRTIIASGLPLSAASEIAEALSEEIGRA